MAMVVPNLVNVPLVRMVAGEISTTHSYALQILRR